MFFLLLWLSEMLVYGQVTGDKLSCLSRDLLPVYSGTVFRSLWGAIKINFLLVLPYFLHHLHYEESKIHDQYSGSERETLLETEHVFLPSKVSIPQVLHSSHCCLIKITGNRRWDSESTQRVHLLAGEVAARMKTKPHSNASDVEVTQDPSKLRYELLALQLMQFPGTWLGECHTKKSSKPSFSTP